METRVTELQTDAEFAKLIKKGLYLRQKESPEGGNRKIPKHRHREVMVKGTAGTLGL